MPNLNRTKNIVILLSVLLLGACKQESENARYVPADASMVTSVNMASLSKKIAWELITGSKLFKEMKQRAPEDNATGILEGIEHSGIDVANTFYVYTNSDNRFESGNVFAGLIPLSDAKAWELYVKENFADATIATDENGRKSAKMGDGMYAGWSSEMLIIIRALAIDGTDDDVALKAELNKAFEVPNGNPITKDNRYQSFTKSGHDFTFWLNQGKLTADLNDNMGNQGLPISPELMKGGVLSCGVDFERGKISGDMNYYLPDLLKDVASRSITPVDKEMLNRFPKSDIDFIWAFNMPSETTKKALEKAGLYGLLNTALSSADLDIEFILDAFTGDMAMTLNDFRLHTELREDPFMGEVVQHKKQKAEVKMNYCLKLNKKENFMKLVGMAQSAGLQKTSYGYAFPLSAHDSVYMMLEGAYVIISTNKDNATSFVSGEHINTPFPERVSKELYEQPYYFFVDVHNMMSNIDPAITGSATDSAMIQVSKGLIDKISASGGAYADKAYKYKLSIDFVDTDENSLLQLIDFGARLKDISENKTLQEM